MSLTSRPLIPDNVYHIWNGEFANYAVDLSDGKIVAWRDHDGTSSRDKWVIKNNGGNGNQITIENALVHGKFACVQQEDPGAPLVGCNDQTLWTLVKVDQGYYIQTGDGDYVWDLSKGVDYEPIVIRHHHGQAEQKWSFEVVGE